MKFFHLGDLHFGKELHETSLLEDQRAWVDEFIKKVDSCGVDAVVIAGDIYDKKIPSPEAMQLFDDLLTKLVEREKYVYIIPGNHDHEVRLSHYSKLLEKKKVYIAGTLQKEMMHCTWDRPGEEPVTFWLMPYMYPKRIGDLLGREDLTTYDLAVRAYLEEQDIDKTTCNVLIAHQNVVNGDKKPEHSDSESVTGGIGEMDYTAFDTFDYVALGHIHNAQHIGREFVRYAGCPLYYDFSEEKRDKRLTLVTINSKKEIHKDRVEIPFLHKLCRKTGTVDELVEIGRAMPDKEKYYIQCVVTDQTLPQGTNEKLRVAFGYTLISKIRQRDQVVRNSGDLSEGQETKRTKKSINEQFRDFYEASGNLLENPQKKLIEKIIEQQSRDQEYIFAKDSSSEKKKTAEQKSIEERKEKAEQELIDEVYKMIDQDEEVTE